MVLDYDHDVLEINLDVDPAFEDQDGEVNREDVFDDDFEDEVEEADEDEDEADDEE